MSITVRDPVAGIKNLSLRGREAKVEEKEEKGQFTIVNCLSRYATDTESASHRLLVHFATHL